MPKYGVKQHETIAPSYKACLVEYPAYFCLSDVSLEAEGFHWNKKAIDGADKKLRQFDRMHYIYPDAQTFIFFESDIHMEIQTKHSTCGKVSTKNVEIMYLERV